MFGGHFYHATIRRFVSVFGTLFNNVIVMRQDSSGNVKSTVRVPLAYGPKEKFLARIDEQADLQDPKVTIKLPRMSFEIDGIQYDTQSKLNRANKMMIDGKKHFVFSPYNISMSLNIMAKTQDDALQIIEQILPYFQPEYTVTIKEGVSDNVKTDVPITLTSVQLLDQYDGGFMERRAIIYTLNFEGKIRFYGPSQETNLIKRVIINTFDQPGSDVGYEQYVNQVDPITADPDGVYTIIKEVNLLDNPNRGVAIVSNVDGTLEQLDSFTGSVSGATGYIEEVNGSTIVVNLSSGAELTSSDSITFGNGATADVDRFYMITEY